jgi:hypothetical protein
MGDRAEKEKKKKRPLQLSNDGLVTRRTAPELLPPAPWMTRNVVLAAGGWGFLVTAQRKTQQKRAMPMEKKPIFVLQTNVEGGSPERRKGEIKAD